MTDTPATPAPAASPSAELATARSAGAATFIATADRLTAQGAVLSYADRKAVDEVRGVIARSQSPGGQLSERDALATADRLIAGGMPVERVQQVMAESGVDYTPDDRTPAQIAHDKQFGMTEHRVMTEDYHFSLAGLPAEGAIQFNSDARDFASSLGLDADRGSSLITTIQRVARELDAAPDHAQQQAAWEAQLVSLHGDKLAERRALVDELLKGAEGNELPKRLVSHGAINNPMLFQTLLSRAMTFTAWAAERP